MNETNLPFIRKRLLIPILLLSGSALSLSFDPVNLWVFAYFSLAPLYFLTFRRTNKSTFFMGCFWGVAHFYFSYIWLSAVKPLGYLNPLLVALIWTAIPGLWIYLLRKLYLKWISPDPTESLMDKPAEQFIPNSKASILLLISGSFLWLFFEWFRFWFCTGFPWNVLGNTQVYVKPVLNLASSLGILGVSFPVILTNMFIGLLVERYFLSKKAGIKFEFPKALTITFLILFISPFIFNQAVKVENKADHTLRAGLVQGHFIPDLYKRLSYEEVINQIQTYNSLSRELVAKQKPDFLLWPETAVAVSYSTFPPYKGMVDKLNQDLKIPFLMGTSYIQQNNGAEERYNSALFFKKGRIEDAYSKIHLVPYGEYTPFKGIIPDTWHKKLNEFSGMGPGLTEGKKYTIFNLSDELRFGVNICFEDVFPKNSLIYARRNANFLVTLTNDAWFPDNSGGAQHTAHSIFRAVETGLPLLRSGNHSESSVILPDGTIKDLLVDPKTGSRFYRGSAIYEVPICLAPEQTFYVRYPMFFIIIIVSITSLLFLTLIISYFQKKLTFKEKLDKLKEE